VTGVAVGAGRRLPSGGAAQRASRAGETESALGTPRLALELILFAALGGLGVVQWSRLVVDPPSGGLLAALAVALAGGAALAATRALRDWGWMALLARIAVALVAFGLAMVAVGLPSLLLAPAQWGELVGNVRDGLGGIYQSDLPYNGPDEWIRLTLLLGAPALLVAGAAVAFWPGPRREARRVLALVPLVAVFGVAVTLDSPASELLWGVPLTVAAGAWLWLPRIEAGRAVPALAAIAVAGVIAVPIAARLDPGQPWWDYQSWNWFGSKRPVSFEWDHSYGPLEWPQRGTTLLEVKSDRPLYWKTSVLDRFDGFTWQRAERGDTLASAERRARREMPGVALPTRHRDWITEASFDIGPLNSSFVVGAGTPQVQDGLDNVRINADGTMTAGDGPIGRGDSYAIATYAPRPSEVQLQNAPARYPHSRFADSTLIGLPTPAATNPSGDPTVAPSDPSLESAAGLGPSRGLAMPLWGEHDPVAQRAVLASTYASVYRLARRWVADSPTPYIAARTIENRLRTGYQYRPNVPEHAYPLASFLFQDRAGYCQQFSGTMALMLRMVGVPSRVVTGFAPGRFDSDNNLYEIQDFDAHSWVEVYFRGIGWVTFDPTPAAAPAAAQETAVPLDTLASDQALRNANTPRLGAHDVSRNLSGDQTPGSAEGGGSGPWGVVGLVLLGLVGVALAAGALIAWRRHRALARGAVVDEQLAELRRALTRLGFNVPAGATLLGLERRFASAGRRPVAAYAAGLRANRYEPERQAPPGPPARRALRRALSRGGLRQRLLGLVAIPLGGPTRRP
jgi:transglutaminase-like putative cysteine protease